MKRLLILLLSLIVVLFTTKETFAQREKGASLLTLGLGMSIEAIVATSGGVNDDVTGTATPTFNAMYDYGITENFSIGAAIGYNSFSITDKSQSYVDANGNIQTNEIRATAARTNIAIRPLYHWGKKEDLEWHTGLRLAYSMWNVSVTATDPFYQDTDYDRVNVYSFQVLFGSRAYFTETLALTFDLGIGAPYFASLGLSMKL